MLANITNQVVVVVSQIAVVPILISAWGVGGFGTWIVLTAVPAYMGLSDFGLSISAKSDMAIRMSKGDVIGAAHTLSSVLAIAVIASGMVSAIYLTTIFVVDWTSVFSLQEVSEPHAKLILIFGLIQVLFYQTFLFSATTIRAIGRPALEGYLAALGRGSEICAVAVVAGLGGSIVEAACAWACTRAVLSIVIWTVVFLKVPRLRPAIALVRWQRIKYLTAPSMAYAMMPLAQAIFIQGTTLAVSLFAGPVIAATFNTTRVITRIGVQAANTINNTFVPYYSYAIGRSVSIKSIYHEHLALLLMALGAYAFFVCVFGERLIGIVSRWQIPFEKGLFYVLVAAASAEMLFSAAISVRSAANRVGTLTVIYATLAVVAVGSSYFLGNLIGIVGVGSLVLAANMAMLAACVLQLRG
jgi:O-antigen/teichoic acid export membrane protein